RPEVVGRELHGERATLSSAYRHLLRDVEERTSELPPSVEDADYAVPLDHEEPAVAGRPRYERRGGELPNLDEPHPGRTRGWAHRGTGRPAAGRPLRLPPAPAGGGDEREQARDRCEVSDGQPHRGLLLRSPWRCLSAGCVEGDRGAHERLERVCVDLLS